MEPVFLAGSVEPAASGQDASLFAVDADVSGRMPAGWTLLQTADGHTLFEAEGFLPPGTPGHEAIAELLEEILAERPFQLYFLGAYAQPFSVES